MTFASDGSRPRRASFHVETGETLVQHHEGTASPSSSSDIDAKPSPAPRHFSPLRKWLTSLLTLLSLAAVLSNGSAYTVAHVEIASEFNIDESTFAHTYWPVTTWALGGALFALVGTPLMEDHGLYYPFLASWLAMIVTIVPQAVARNFATILVTRFITGGFVGILATSCIAIFTDLWEDEVVRGVWIGCYMLAYLLGSSIGPVIGAIVLSTGLGWRWIFWVQAIYLGIIFIPLAILIPRHGAPVPTVEPTTKPTNKPSIALTIRRAIRMLLCEPLITACTAWTSFSLGTIYLFTQSTEQVFQVYSFTPTQSGFVQSAIVIGELCALPALFLANHLYWADTRSRPTPRPEARLHLALPGGLVGVTLGMLLYAWTCYPSIHWIVPSIGLFLVGWGSIVVVSSVGSFVVDSYASVAGSAMTALALGENTFIGFLPFASLPMYSKLGLHWASFLLAMVSVVLSSIPVFVYWRAWGVRTPGEYWREARS